MQKKNFIIGLNDEDVLIILKEESCLIFPKDMPLVLCRTIETTKYITDDSIVIMLYFYDAEDEKHLGDEMAQLENEFKAKSFTNFFQITSKREEGHFILALSRVCRIIKENKN
ncbi:MAG: hypothetical protein WCF93_03730 [Candidatus Moraniibacteriota bacterium]